MSPFNKRLRDFAYVEWGGISRDVWFELRTKKLRAIPLTLSACLSILTLQVIQHSGSTGTEWVNRLGGVYATLPWWKALLRTPLSLFVPDPSLPVWGLIAQVVFMFGIAEMTVGRRHTLGIGLLATLAGTSFARYSLAVGPDGFLGLPVSTLVVRDTGPSAAVVALGVYVACRYRAWWTGGVLILAMLVEVVLIVNLAGFEHLTAIVATLLLCALEGHLRRRREAELQRESPRQPPG
ncbi:hypothetical protein [Streptomyces sp. RKAG293]|uniref:hypothetical protein n=1 Tax=Streptomyces sp. RKAG293 TaxID=2893403 RepID=UPI002033D733|nr:hypothetical protein [Streptomyces sp. RKAG293]MCM2418923.1 hypothetical protein [Streptomyces sp. RKAG293]